MQVLWLHRKYISKKFFLKNDLKVIISLKKIYRSSGQSFRNGTCLTNAECLEMGGASSGSCAGGWLFIINYIQSIIYVINHGNY